MQDFWKSLIVVFIVLSTHQAQARKPSLFFKDFLKQYQLKSPTFLQAQRSLSLAEKMEQSANDLWQARFEAKPEMNFLTRKFDSGIIDDISNRSQNVSGSYTQQFPTGTRLQLSGRKFLEVNNPLFSSTDREYAATITQDLFRNAFGETQRAQARKGSSDFKVAELEYKQALVGSCEEAFTLFVSTYIQQEITELLNSQLADAKKAQSISKKLFRDKLINKVDRLTSESDFLNTQQDADRSMQKLINGKRQIQAYLAIPLYGTKLNNPSQALMIQTFDPSQETLSEVLASQRVTSQEFDVARSRSDRRTDLQLSLQAGERFGRSRIQSTDLAEFKEEFLMASLSVGFDVINKTEDSDLKTAIQLKNSFEKQKAMTQLNQRSTIENLYANHRLLQEQIQSSQQQITLLEEKMKIAFRQMQRAKLDFQNYLLHRNAFFSQKINYLNLKKEFWLNQFAIQKEYAHQQMKLCEVVS